MNDKLNISYSIGGMAQYYESLTELVGYRLLSTTNKIVINTSVQPNSIPHFGTITTLFSAFALARMIKDKCKIATVVEVDFIECGPEADYHQNHSDYCLSIARIPSPKKPCMSIADYYISTYYEPLLSQVMNISEINYSTRKYDDFQKDTVVRSTVIAICNDRIFFESLLNPKNGKLHIRTECPTCGCIDKHLKKTQIIDVQSSGFSVSSCCDKHGSYDVEINKANQNYMEINAQLRDISKGVLMNSYINSNILGIMFDGGDWGGTWTHHVHCKSMQRLGHQPPIRLFAPLILDWSGGKLSKSIYLNGSPTGSGDLNDYDTFIQKYGDSGLQCIYKEVTNWILSPKKFFRNYSAEYILEILKRDCRI